MSTKVLFLEACALTEKTMRFLGYFLWFSGL
ncbi:hypothetical protein CsSME_00025872 [Camellia sinensis var. sinensis]